MITEMEAYDGFCDKASHAHLGKTKRNEPMFSHPGYFYVYFTYGMHWLLNIVTGKKDYPAAVLIRGAISLEHASKSTDIFPLENSSSSRKLSKSSHGPRPLVFSRHIPSPIVLTGPAKLTKFLKIDGKLNGKQVGKKTGLWLEDRGVRIKKNEIKKTPRIGVDFAGPVWAKKRWRFLIGK